MTFEDHVDQVYDCQDRCGGSETIESQHGFDPSFDESMVLFVDVIEVLPPDHIDQDRATKAFEYLVYGFNTRCVRAAFVDDDLPWQPVEFESASEEFRRSGSIPALGQHKIEGLAVFVDRSAKVNPFAFDPHISFIHSPQTVCRTPSIPCCFSNKASISTDQTVQPCVIHVNTTFCHDFFQILV